MMIGDLKAEIADIGDLKAEMADQKYLFQLQQEEIDALKQSTSSPRRPKDTDARCKTYSRVVTPSPVVFGLLYSGPLVRIL